MSPSAGRKKVFTPQEAMGLAIIEAYKGAGFVSPNPLVGCVILDEDNLLLSTGYHKKYGGPHAEIEALKGVSEELLQGAHMYVTLEPCAHQGQTSPCASKLAALPLASVTYGLIDPNPLVSGKGIELIKKAGIRVQHFDGLKEELEDLAEIFLHNMKTKKPFVAMKVASSLDGQMGLKSGDSKWITNEKSRTYAHYLRGIYDAIVVGRRTVEIDNPSLNIRHPDFPNKMNKVVVMDPYGDLVEKVSSLNLGRVHDPSSLYFIVSKKVASSIEAPYNIVSVPFHQETGFDLEMLLQDLYGRGIYSLLLEGGAYVYKTFLQHHHIQRLYHFQAPILIGAEQGLPWTQGFGVASMADKIPLERIQTHFFDNDLLITGRMNLGAL